MTADEGLLQNALLGVVVPEASNSSIPEVLALDADNGEQQLESLLPSVRQRSLLFFDEKLTVYIVLQYPVDANDLLNETISRLELRLDCFAISGDQNDTDSRKAAHDASGPRRDLIYSQQVQKVGDPYIALNETAEEQEPRAFAIWEVEVILNRPRVRLSSPAVVFSAVGLIRSAKPSSDGIEEDLPAFKPMPVNVLDAFKADPSMKDSAPYLSSSTLERILPDALPPESFMHLRSQPSTATRIIPAVSARVRYSRMNTYSQRPRTVASLDFEVTPFIRFDVELDQARVSLSNDGIVEPISSVDLPAMCRPKDDLTLLYTLVPSDHSLGPATSTASVATLEIHLSAKVHMSPLCVPHITMRWRSSVDFTLPLNPSYGAPSQILQRNNRPSDLPSVLNASTPSHSVAANLTSTSPDGTLTISFTTPTSPVQLGSVFSWRVLVVNHSPRARKLSLVAVSSRAQRGQYHQRDLPSRHNPKSSRASQYSTTSNPNISQAVAQTPQEIAPAFIDENIVHAIQRSSSTNDSSYSTTLISMSPDVRIGPLSSRGAHECEMKFLALRAGWSRLEAIRVIDVGASERQSVSSQGNVGDTPPVEWVLRDLPDIWVVDEVEDVSGRSSRSGNAS